MACYSDRTEPPRPNFACRHCGNPLASSTASHFIPLGSDVQISGKRVRVRCDKCRRSSLWYPTVQEEA